MENEAIVDHRSIGRSLKLFHIQEEAAGSVFWHPNGWTLFRTIENYIRAKLTAGEYQEVKTPLLFSKTLFEKSGHWDKFGSNIYCTGDRVSVEEHTNIPTNNGYRLTGVEEFISEATHVFKPMNCPAHVQIFNSETVSYRKLPLRMAEFGCCHRNEPSGALHGIMRVRQFTQDDAHIFCTEDQIMDETASFCKLLLGVYKDFGFTDVKIGFSTRPDVRAGSDDDWDKAETALASAVTAAGLEYEVYPGEGAFYGPKLEFALKDSKGREWQCGTLQLDLVLPKRLDAFYTTAEGKREHPVMLHRAILGSFERFIGILLEHYDGRLPDWLAPVQAVVLAIKPEAYEYAKQMHADLLAAGIRATLDIRDENMSARVKEHSEMLVPYILCVGGREVQQNKVAIRSRSGQSVMDREEMLVWAKELNRP